jgi:hypothetical protein
MMAKAGYNPIEMARFFEKLQANGGSGGPQFLSDHPNPGNRVKIVQEEIAFMPRRDFTETGTGELRSMQGRLGSLPAASATRGRTGGTVAQGDPRPSGSLRQYNGNGFSISHPDNWEVFGGDGGGSITIAPRSGLVQDTGGGVAVGYGLIASHANTYHDNDLRNATADLVGQLRQSNPAMQVSGRQQSTRVNGQNALVTTLYNQSPLSGREVDMLVTMQGRDGLFYMVFIAPEADYRNMQGVYEQMLRSVRLR